MAASSTSIKVIFSDVNDMTGNWDLLEISNGPSGRKVIKFKAKGQEATKEVTKEVTSETPNNADVSAFAESNWAQVRVSTSSGLIFTLERDVPNTNTTAPAAVHTVVFLNYEKVFPTALGNFMGGGDAAGYCRCTTACAWDPSLQAPACYVQSDTCKDSAGNATAVAKPNGLAAMRCSSVRQQSQQPRTPIYFVKTAAPFQGKAGGLFTINELYTNTGALVDAGGVAGLGLGPDGARFRRVEAPPYLSPPADAATTRPPWQDFGAYFNRATLSVPTPGVPRHDDPGGGRVAQYISAGLPLSQFVRTFFRYVETADKGSPKAVGNTIAHYYMPEKWQGSAPCPYALLEDGERVDALTSAFAVRGQAQLGSPDSWFEGLTTSGRYPALEGLAPHPDRSPAAKLLAGKVLRGDPVVATSAAAGGATLIMRATYLNAEGKHEAGNLVTPVLVTQSQITKEFAAKVVPHPLTEPGGGHDAALRHLLPPLLRMFTGDADERVERVEGDPQDVYQIKGLVLKHPTLPGTVGDSTGRLVKGLRKITVGREQMEVARAELRRVHDQGFAWLLSRILSVTMRVGDRTSVYLSSDEQVYGTESPVPLHADGSVDMYQLAFAMSLVDPEVAKGMRKLAPFGSRAAGRLAPWTLMSAPGARVVQANMTVDGQERGYYGCAPGQAAVVDGVCGGGAFVQALGVDFATPGAAGATGVADLKADFCAFYKNSSEFVAGKGGHVQMLRRQYDGVCPDAKCSSYKQCNACGEDSVCVWCRGEKCNTNNKGKCVAARSGCDEAKTLCKPHCSRCPDIDGHGQCLTAMELDELAYSMWDRTVTIFDYDLPVWYGVPLALMLCCYCAGCGRSSRRQRFQMMQPPAMGVMQPPQPM